MEYSEENIEKCDSCGDPASSFCPVCNKGICGICRPRNQYDAAVYYAHWKCLTWKQKQECESNPDSRFSSRYDLG